MAVDAVKYNHVSSAGSDFANKGDKKSIDSNTANQIYKDCNQGYTDITTSDLNENKKAAAKKINSLVDEDTLEYSADEKRQTGTQQIDTTNADESNTGGQQAVETIGTAVSGSAQALCIVAMAADGFTAASCAVAVMFMSVASLGMAAAFKFMPDQQKLEAETKATEGNNTTIDNYTNQMSADMDNMVAEQEQYEALSSAKLDNMMGSLDEKTQIDSEIEIYMSQGNMEKVNELKQKSDAIAQGGAEDQAAMDAQMDPLKENLETYRSEASEAQGVKDSGDKVAQFLHRGKPLGVVGYINAGLNALTAVFCGVTALGLFPKIGIDIVPTALGKVLFTAAAALYGLASGFYFDAAAKDLEADKAGTGMDDHLTDLGDNVEGTFGFANDTEVGYITTDGECADTYQGSSENAAQTVENAGKGIEVVINPEEEPEPAVA